MDKRKKIIIKISFVILLIIFFSSGVFANESNESENKNNSIYKYSALENEFHFPDTTSNSTPNSSKEKLPAVDSETHIVINENAEKLKYITEHQADSIIKSDNAISSIESRGILKSFFMGNRLGVLKYQMVQMKDQSYILSLLALDAEDKMVEDQINSQINVLKLQQMKVEKFILEQKEEFSLFGWFVNSI